MGRGVNAILPAQTWRVAALTMMRAEELAALLSGDPSDAASWVEAAAACGIAEAQLRLGRMLLAGEGIAKNEHAAFACFRCAADTDDAEALNMLGRCHENGWGTGVDLQSAVECYRRAADQGLSWAQYNLGHMLLDGTGIARDRDGAFTWYKCAAEQGHVRAMNLLARCYEEGWGCLRDLAAARDWYCRSAEGGYFRGAFNYASILSAENRVQEATMWLAQALVDAPEPTRSHMRRACPAPLRATLY